MGNSARGSGEGAEAGAGEVEAAEVAEKVVVLGEGGVEARRHGVVLCA